MKSTTRKSKIKNNQTFSFFKSVSLRFHRLLLPFITGTFYFYRFSRKFRTFRNFFDDFLLIYDISDGEQSGATGNRARGRSHALQHRRVGQFSPSFQNQKKKNSSFRDFSPINLAVWLHAIFSFISSFEIYIHSVQKSRKSGILIRTSSKRTIYSRIFCVSKNGESLFACHFARSAPISLSLSLPHVVFFLALRVFSTSPHYSSFCLFLISIISTLPMPIQENRCFRWPNFHSNEI